MRFFSLEKVLQFALLVEWDWRLPGSTTETANGGLASTLWLLFGRVTVIRKCEPHPLLTVHHIEVRGCWLLALAIA